MRKNTALLCLLLLLFWLLPGAVSACEQVAVRPAVHVKTSEKPVRFDISQSVSDLNAMDIDTVSPYPSHYHTNVGGLMNGRLTLEHRVKFSQKTEGDKGCFNISEVHVDLIISPTIYIASDYHNQPCWFKQIFIHEAKHVDVDRAIIAKYKDRIVDGLNLMLMEPDDYNSGWVDASFMGEQQYDMRSGIEHGLDVLFKLMLAERMERQQAVDNINEYAEISRACHSS